MSALFELEADLIAAEAEGDNREANRLRVVIAQAKSRARLEALLVPVEEGVEI